MFPSTLHVAFRNPREVNTAVSAPAIWRKKIKEMCFCAKLSFSSSSTSLPVSHCSYNHTRLDFYNQQHLSLGLKPHTQDARFRPLLEEDGPCPHHGAPNNAWPSTMEAKQHPGRTTRPQSHSERILLLVRPLRLPHIATSLSDIATGIVKSSLTAAPPGAPLPLHPTQPSLWPPYSRPPPSPRRRLRHRSERPHRKYLP
jgi:hypothetical protein